MEDRYLFKAKRINNGEWVTGSLLTCEDGTCKIATSLLEVKTNGPILVCAYDVDRDTICQCTGLKDKNGNLIWENDIVKRNFYLYSSEAKYEEKENCGIVKYDKEYARFGYQCSVFAMLSESKKHDTIEVVGNIFDNPELLESEE